MKNIFSILMPGLVLSFVYISCSKPDTGYISDNLYYKENPFVVGQGVVAYSSPMEADGSTAPLKIRLLDVRDKGTGLSVLDSITKEREVATFAGEITLQDTSVAQLAKKVTTSLKRALYINPLGGRIEMTGATSYIKPGSYVIDVEVTNVKGTRVIKNACDIELTAIANPYTFVYRRIQTADPGNDAVRTLVTEQDANGFPIDIKHVPGAENKIVMKWVDKNNKAFNPKTDIGRWDGTTPIFKDWSPFYPEVITDSTLEYAFPKTGLTYPVYATSKLGGDNGVCYYRLLSTANDINKNMRLTTAIRYNVDGRYEVTFHIKIASKK